MNTCLWLLALLVFTYAAAMLIKSILLKTMYDVEGEKKEQMYRELEAMRAEKNQG